MMTDAQTFLVIGGARSGKTRHAMSLAEARPKRVYVATAEAHDDEMRARIALHRQERDGTWSTLEAPLDLTAAILSADDPATAILVDCLTLWLSNLMAANHDPEAASTDLIAALARTQARVVLVTNEVGLGIVPANKLARDFRDAKGRLNQQIAAAVEQVDFVAAGIPLTMKPGRTR